MIVAYTFTPTMKPAINQLFVNVNISINHFALCILLKKTGYFAVHRNDTRGVSPNKTIQVIHVR